MKINFIATSFMACLHFAAIAQTQIIIDLAEEKEGSITVPIKTGNYDIIVKNRLPNKAYEISIEREDKVIPPLKIDQDIVKTQNFTADCDALEKLITVIYSLDDETALPQKKEELMSRISNPGSGCDETVEKAKKLHDALKNYKYPITDLSKSETIKVTIKRKNNAGKDLEWIRIYESPARGKWLTNYSFNFVATQMGSKERRYFAKSDGSTEFVITEEENRQWVKFVPGVTFTWLYSKGFRDALALGGSGGIGFDLENPVVYLGFSFVYNQNISLTLGYAAIQVKQLNGKYSVGAKIKENLTSDQLMVDTYRFNPFISASFRFDKNPFKVEK